MQRVVFVSMEIRPLSVFGLILCTSGQFVEQTVFFIGLHVANAAIYKAGLKQKDN